MGDFRVGSPGPFDGKTTRDFPLLTEYDLRNMNPNTIFAHGFGYIEHPWFNDVTILEPDGRSVRVKWVAVRGIMWDWAIYHSLPFEKERYFDGTEHLNTSIDRIVRSGDKVRNEWEIRSMVPCSEDAFKLYRY